MSNLNINIKSFDEKVDSIKKHFDTLMEMPPTTPIQVLDSNQKISGVYIFSEIINDTEKFMYVGQSESIINRLAEHCAIKNYQKANFAYKLTVNTTGISPIPFSPNSTKESMFRINEFVTEFNKITNRIKHMNYRFIAVNDKLEKNLLEMYAAVVLEAEFNEFN